MFNQVWLKTPQSKAERSEYVSCRIFRPSNSLKNNETKNTKWIKFSHDAMWITTYTKLTQIGFTSRQLDTHGFYVLLINNGAIKSWNILRYDSLIIIPGGGVIIFPEAAYVVQLSQNIELLQYVCILVQICFNWVSDILYAIWAIGVENQWLKSTQPHFCVV